MTHKIVFTSPFYRAAEPSRFASSVITPRGYKVGRRSYATYIFPHDIPSLRLKKKEEIEK
jgi:hypothetical protein